MKAIEIQVFRPALLRSERDRTTQLFPLNAAPIIREGRLLSDNSMPPRDWRAYDVPSCKRMTARVVRRAKVLTIQRQAG